MVASFSDCVACAAAAAACSGLRFLAKAAAATGLTEPALPPASPAAAWLAGAFPVGSRVQLSGQAGVAHYGSAAELARIRPATAFGTFGANVKVTSRLALIAQLDAHTAIADSDLRFLKPALVLSYGARYALSPSLGLDIGMQEDAATNRSPDVTFYFGLNSRPARH